MLWGLKVEDGALGLDETKTFRGEGGVGDGYKRETRHKTQDTRNKAQETRNKAQDTRNKAQDTQEQEKT